MIMELLLSMVVGILLGVLSSLIAWWILFHYIVPRISFSAHIRKTETEDTKSRSEYRIKVKNVGKRTMIDIELIARYRVKGVNPSRSSNWKWENLKIDSDRIPMLQPKTNRIFRIYPEQTETFKYAPYPENIRVKAHECTLTLEDLLGLDETSGIQMYIFGFDNFSGARKLFISQSYDINSIKSDLFD